MINEQRILVFSDSADNNIRDFIRRKIDNNYRVDFASNIPALITSINLNKYDLCIINPEPAGQSQCIDDVIRILMKYRIPVYLRHLADSGEKVQSKEKTIKTINVDFGSGGRRFKKGSLKYDREYRSVNYDKKITNQIGATLNHEINSPLMAISANVEMLRTRPDLDVECARKLETIELAVSQIKDVLEKMLELRDIRWIETPAGKMLDLKSGVKSSNEKSEIIGESVAK